MRKNILLFMLQIAPLFLFAQTHTLLKNIGTGSENGIPSKNQSTVWNSKAYFITLSPDGFSNRIWSTDGTSVNTKQVLTSDYPEMNFLTSINNGLIFSAWKDTNPGIYKSNGTQAGTILLKSFPQREVVFMHALNDHKVIFVTSNFAEDSTSLWSTDGTANGTILLGNFEIKPDFIRFSFYMDRMVFTEKSTNFDLFPPLITDGSVQGTQTVENFINSVILGAVNGVSSAVGTEDFLFVQTTPGGKVFDGTALANFSFSTAYNHGFKLGKKNIIFSSAQIVIYDSLTKISTALNINPLYFSEPILAGGRVYFHDDFEEHVYSMDGNNGGTKELSSQSPGQFNYDPYLVAYQNNILYTSNQGSNTELWSIDLATETDSSFSQIKSASSFSVTPYAFSIGDYLVYARNTIAEGNEYWVYTPMITGTNEPVQYRPIAIAPNPASDEIQFSFDGPVAVSTVITIFDIHGIVVQKIPISTNAGTIDVTSLVAGQYFVCVKSNLDYLFKGSFIKK